MAAQSGGFAAAGLKSAPPSLAARLKENLLAERERWPLWLPAFLGAGIGIYFWLPQEPAPALGPMLLVVAAGWLVLAYRRARAVAAAAVAAALALGFAAAQWQTRTVAAPVLPHRIGPVTVVGRLEAVDPLPKGARLVIAPTAIDRIAPASLPARVRIRLRQGDAGAIPGAWISLRAVLMPPPAPAMPGAFDFERRAWFDRLGGVGYALGAPHWIEPPGGSGIASWRVALQALRATVSERIRAALPGSDGAVATAIIAGDTHAIPPAEADAFRNAGLAHILVIAGLHMGMVAGAAFFAVRALLALVPRLALYHPIKKYAAFASLALAFGYMLLSGATVSSRRAFVMIGLVFAAVLLDRVSVSARSVALAATAILLMTPESATGPSFQMSFAAVAALVACYEGLRPLLQRWHAHAGPGRRFLLYLAGIALTTVVTTAATMPFTIYHFNRFALYSVLANALAVPITGFWIMPWAIISVLLMPLGLEAGPLALMGAGIHLIASVAFTVTALPGAVVTLPSMPAWSLLAMALGGLWLCIWRQPWRWLGAAPLTLGYVALVLMRPPDLLIADNGRAVAVLAADGTYLPSDAAAARGLEAAVRRVGSAFGPAWPEDGVAAQGMLRCDAEACLYRARGRLVALERGGDALAEDCRSADLVVSPVASHRACRGPPIIDRIDDWRLGGHAVWLDAAGIRIETVRAWQGTRPWVPRRALSSAASTRRAGPAP